MSMISKSISDAQEGEFIFFPETAIIFDKEDLHTWISDIDKEAKANMKQMNSFSTILYSKFKKEILKL